MASIIKADTLQSTTANVFVLNSSGTEYARFDSSGNLGIGTASPSFKLHVDGIVNTTNYYNINTNRSAPAVDAALYRPADGTLGFVANASERMRIDSSGNVGIGTTTPLAKLHVNTTSAAAYIGYGANFDNYFQTNNNTYFTNYNGSVEHARITSTGLLQFNSGYGSVATAYGCRAWVNFNGTGVVAINASGNVASITDNGTGNYTVNFTTAMPDVNYAVVCGGSTLTSNTSVDTWVNGYVFTTTSVQIEAEGSASTTVDRTHVSVVIFR